MAASTFTAKCPKTGDTYDVGGPCQVYSTSKKQWFPGTVQSFEEDEEGIIVIAAYGNRVGEYPLPCKKIKPFSDTDDLKTADDVEFDDDEDEWLVEDIDGEVLDNVGGYDDDDDDEQQVEAQAMDGIPPWEEFVEQLKKVSFFKGHGEEGTPKYAARLEKARDTYYSKFKGAKPVCTAIFSSRPLGFRIWGDDKGLNAVVTKIDMPAAMEKGIKCGYVISQVNKEPTLGQPHNNILKKIQRSSLPISIHFISKRKIYNITFPKKPLGFTIWKDSSGRNAKVIRIDSPEAGKSGVRLGSRLIKVGGGDVENFKHQDILDAIKKAPVPIELTFLELPKLKRAPTKKKKKQQEEYEVEVTCRPFGFNFIDTENRVHEVHKNKPAHKAGLLSGSEILTIDGNNVVGRQDWFEAFFKTAKVPFKMKLRYPKTSRKTKVDKDGLASARQ